jgi:hypothetical protein
VGDEGVVLVSADGVQWNRPATGTNSSLPGVAYGAGRFVALASAGGTLTSADGEVWSPGNTGQTQSLASIAFGAGRFVSVGFGGTILTSEDGLAWSAVSPAVTTVNLTRVRFLNGEFLACGGSGTVFRSADGLNWTAHSASLLDDIGWSGSTYLGVGYQRLYSSTNAQTWYPQSFAPFGTIRLNDVIHADGKFVSVGDSGWIETAPDGQTWTTRSSGSVSTLYGIAHGAGRFVAIGNNGLRTSSTDGVSWTAQVAPDSPRPAFYAIVHNGQRFITGGSYGAIHTSEDGVTWTVRTSGITSQIESIAVGPGRVVALGFNGEITASSDGLVWAGQTTIQNPLRRIFYLNGRFVVEDIYGNRHSSPDGLAWSSAPATDAFGHYDIAELNGVYFGVHENSAIRVLEPVGGSGSGAEAPTDASSHASDSPSVATSHASSTLLQTRTGGRAGVATKPPRILPRTNIGSDEPAETTRGSEPSVAFTLWGWPADLDQDGTPELIDYASGGASATTVATLPDGRLRVVFLRRSDDPALRVFAESSSTFDVSAGWRAGLVETEVLPLDSTIEQVTVETVEGDQPTRAIRVRAEIRGGSDL